MKLTIFTALLLTTTLLRGAPVDGADPGAADDNQKQKPIELALQNAKADYQTIVINLVLRNNDTTPLKVPHRGVGKLFYKLKDATGKVYNMNSTPLIELPGKSKDLAIMPGKEHTFTCELRPQHWFDAPCPIMSRTFFLPEGVRPFAKGESSWVYPVKLTARMTGEGKERDGALEVYHSPTILVPAKAEQAVSDQPAAAPELEPETKKQSGSESEVRPQ